MRVRSVARWAVILMLVGVGGVSSALADASGRFEQAQQLFDEARADIARGTIDGRRSALQRLERARQLDPTRADIQLEIARLEYQVGFLGRSRHDFQTLADRQPEDPDVRLGLAGLWRRDYLKYLEPASLDLAIGSFTEVVRARPTDTDAWINLVALLVEKDDLKAAFNAAVRARESAPGRADALLALAHVSFRLGQVERADSAFREAIPRLAPSARRRYDDIAPVATEQDTMTLNTLAPARRAEFLRRFWISNDPDLGTPENEAQLEYWSRVTQAYLLFYDPRRGVWDQRGEVYVRYGPPALAVYNPVGTTLSSRIQGVYGVRINTLFPVNVLVWLYPELGMIVTLEDHLLTEHYQNPVSTVQDTDPRPDPYVLAFDASRVESGGGRGVFPALPPRSTPLPVDGVIARFEGEDHPRAIGLLATESAPSESTVATWVVFDSTRREVARFTRELSPSTCDPARLRVADFASSLPPGAYLFGLGVRDGHGGRGALRSELTLDAPATRVSMSDLVVSCGGAQVDPGTPDQPPAVRLTANPGAEVGGRDPLTVYFEAYHLWPGLDGLSRLEITTVVRTAERDRRSLFMRVVAPRRPLPDVSVTREITQAGTIRRQFVNVPVQPLPPGRYIVEITVHDQVSDLTVTRSTEFRKI